MDTFAKRPSRLKRLQLIAVTFLTVVGLINYIDRSALSIASASIRGELSLSPAEMVWLLSAFSLAYGFSQLPVGVLLGRLGSRRVLGTRICFWSVVQLFLRNSQQLQPVHPGRDSVGRGGVDTVSGGHQSGG